MRRPALADPARERTGNRLLDGLAFASGELGANGFRRVQLRVRDRLYEPGPLRAAYFPVDAVCSVFVAVESGTMVETTSAGREGMLGAEIALGATRSAATALCHVAGASYTIARGDLTALLAQSPALRDVTARYTLFLISSLERAVGCNRVHHLEERCARWLLTTLDRAGRTTVLLTHEYLAMALGVQRAAVTLAIASLARAGAIEHGRGSVTVIDRAELVRRSCACYAETAAAYARLFPDAAG